MKTKLTTLILYLIIAFSTEGFCNLPESKDFWRIVDEKAVVWDVYNETRLPHADDIEMAGQRVARILRYDVAQNRQLTVNRDLIFQQLRRFVRTSEPEWYNYRNYLRYTFSDEYLPVMISDQIIFNPPLDSVRIDGKITFYHQPGHEIMIQRTFFPSMTERLWVEKITLTNSGDISKQIQIGTKEYVHNEPGMHGQYTIRIHSDADTSVNLVPGESCSYGVYYSATLNKEPQVTEHFKEAETKRDQFLAEMQQNLVLKTPDPVINTLFYFSKIRAAENIFDTKMGLVHSPGGGNYYAGVWANDQVEYRALSSPIWAMKMGILPRTMPMYNS